MKSKFKDFKLMLTDAAIVIGIMPLKNVIIKKEEFIEFEGLSELQQKLIWVDKKTNEGIEIRYCTLILNQKFGYLDELFNDFVWLYEKFGFEKIYFPKETFPLIAINDDFALVLSPRVEGEDELDLYNKRVLDGIKSLGVKIK